MLKARIVTALFLAAGLLVLLFRAPPAVAAASFAVVAALAAWEWAGLMKIDRAGRGLYAGFIALSCLAAWNQPDFAYPKLWWISAAFWLVAAPLWLALRWRLSVNDLLGYAAGWVLIVPTWAAMAGFHGRGPWLLLTFMALVWVADIAAYFTGRAFGRHKLAPAISPGKTWEGVGGAIAGVLLYGFVTGLTVGGGLLILLTAVSIVGDLFESMVKREAGVKDSSSLLPGHGGILDRIDSLTAALPLAALLVIS